MPATPEVIAFVRGALPPAPARVLEIGAGDGELATALREAGYDVDAIDPDPRGPDVRKAELLDVEGRFDAAVAVVAMHHVEPLEASLEHLAGLVRPGGAMVVDELDVEALDERAVRWWIAHGGNAEDPTAVIDGMRHHIHPVPRIVAALSPAFALSEPVPGPYLHRWHVPPGLLEAEEAAIAAGEIPRVGVRFTGCRREPGAPARLG